MTTQHALTELNAIRDRKGLSPLTPNGLVDMAAINHVEWMTKNGLSHRQGLWGPNLEQRLNNAGFEWTSCAENIAFGQQTVSEALESWMFSPGHRDNMLGNYQYASLFSAANSTGRLYWILVLASH